jgi:hypothetical protein
MQTLPGAHLGVDNRFTHIVNHQSPTGSCEPFDLRVQTIGQIVLAQRVYCLKVIFGRNAVNDSDATLSEDFAINGCGLLACHDER